MIEQGARGDLYRYTVKCSVHGHEALKRAAKAADLSEGEFVQRFFDKFIAAGADGDLFDPARVEAFLAAGREVLAAAKKAVREQTHRAKATADEMAERCHRVLCYLQRLPKDREGLTHATEAEIGVACDIAAPRVTVALQRLIADRRLYRVKVEQRDPGAPRRLFKVMT